VVTGRGVVPVAGRIGGAVAGCVEAAEPPQAAPEGRDAAVVTGREVVSVIGRIGGAVPGRMAVAGRVHAVEVGRRHTCERALGAGVSAGRPVRGGRSGGAV
jgi:hypothetical protein